MRADANARFPPGLRPERFLAPAEVRENSRVAGHSEYGRTGYPALQGPGDNLAGVDSDAEAGQA